MKARRRLQIGLLSLLAVLVLAIPALAQGEADVGLPGLPGGVSNGDTGLPGIYDSAPPVIVVPGAPQGPESPAGPPQIFPAQPSAPSAPGNPVLVEPEYVTGPGDSLSVPCALGRVWG